jgi:hypothetical protein
MRRLAAPSLLDEVWAVAGPRVVWIADRNFCSLGFLFRIAQRPGFFVICQYSSRQGELLGEHHRRGRRPTGVGYEMKKHLREPATSRKRVRSRVTLVLKAPARGGETELHLVTKPRAWATRGPLPSGSAWRFQDIDVGPQGAAKQPAVVLCHIWSEAGVGRSQSRPRPPAAAPPCW